MRLILGTAQLAGRYGVMATQSPSAARAAAVLRAASHLGIRTVDTAPSYVGAEAAIGAAGDGFTVHTKLPPDEEPAAALAASLHCLHRERVQVLYLHDPDVVLDSEDPRLDAATALLGAGAEAIGASVYTREQFLAAVSDPRITVVQAPMNVLDRSLADDDLRLAARNGTEVIARSVLLQGLLGDPAQAMGRVPLIDEALVAFHAVCARSGRVPIELAIGWVRSRPHVAGIVIGAETPGQLESLVRAARSIALSPGELKGLSALPLPSEAAVDPRTWTSL